MTNYLQLGLKAHQSNQLEDAQNYYETHLQHHSKDANAKQLLGLVYSAKGRLSDGIRLMQESLKLAANQPHVFNNLAICQKNNKDPQGAVASFTRAIHLKADYFDAYKKLIALLIDIDSLELAWQWNDKALAIFPENFKLLSQRAEIFQNMDSFVNASNLFQQLLVREPEANEVRHNFAVSLRMQGKPEQACEQYQTLIEKGLSHYQLFHNMANALADLGKLAEAVTFYQKAITLCPAYVDSHINLNELLWELGDEQAFLTSYISAFDVVPDEQPLKYSYAHTLLRLGNYSLVYEFLMQLPPVFMQTSEYYDLLARSQKGMGNIGHALKSNKRGLAYTQTSVEPRLNYAKNLIEVGQVDQAETQLQQIIDMKLEDNTAWAMLGVCWRLTNNRREPYLNNYESLVKEYTINIPSGYNSIEEFCFSVNEYLQTLHTAIRQPLEQTLQGGTQTRGDLFDDTNPLIQALVISVRQCVKDYFQQTKNIERVIPYVDINEFSFSGSWSVRLTQGGLHTSHIHPMGHLSSVFYVEVPKEINNGSSKQGWLTLGQPNVHVKPPLKAVKLIKPVVGKLVLFPSYMWHGTLPFESDEIRTTVAFDVRPKKMVPI